MCGGSSNPLEDALSTVGKAVSDTTEAVGKGIHDVTNSGLVSYDTTTGKFGAGALGEVVQTGIKDVTGASAAENANKIAKQQFEESKNNALKAQQEARARTARDQMSASRSAASSRKKSGTGRTSTSRSSTGGVGTQSVSKLGSDEQDFLGL